MFEDDFFVSKNAAIMLLFGSLVFTLTQILATTWCNANTNTFGYYQDDSMQWHVCVYEMPGEWFFSNGAILLNAVGAISLCVDVVRTRSVWLATRTINLSRVAFSISLLSINFLLEILSHAWRRPSSDNPFHFFYDNFWYMFPVALTLLLISSWSIVKKVELLFTLNKRKR